MSPQVVHPCVSPLLHSQPPPPHIIKTPTSASSHQPHPPVGLIFIPFVISYMYVYTDGLRPARRVPSSAPFLLLCSLPSHSASCLLSSLRCAIIIFFILCVLSPPAIYLSPPCFPLPPRLWYLVLSRSPFYRAPSSLHLPHTRHRLACGWARTVRKGSGARSCCLESRLRLLSHTSSPLRCESFRSGHSTISTPSRRRIYPPFPLFLFSLFPVSLTHRIDNQSRPRPQYSVHRPQRQERE